MRKSQSPAHSPIIRSQVLVVDREDLIQRQSYWLAFWTVAFLLAGILLGWKSADTGISDRHLALEAKDMAQMPVERRDWKR